MSHTRFNRLIVAAIVLCSRVPGSARSQAPQIGDVQTLPIITVSLQVGSMGKESRHATYTPPPGWQVRSHRVYCFERHGASSYSVSTVPAGWRWSSRAVLSDSQQQSLEASAKAYSLSLPIKFGVRQTDAAQDSYRADSSHHALVVDASATGEGFFRGGSGLNLTVIADLVYVGPDSSEAPQVPGSVASK